MAFNTLTPKPSPRRPPTRAEFEFGFWCSAATFAISVGFIGYLLWTIAVRIG